LTKPALPPDEPLLDIDEIQGNVLPGFMKPNLIVCALAIADISLAKPWLRESVASLNDEELSGWAAPAPAQRAAGGGAQAETRQEISPAGP